jgi:hypothetical protein
MREHGRLFYVYDYVVKFNCKISSLIVCRLGSFYLLLHISTFHEVEGYLYRLFACESRKPFYHEIL